IRAVGHARCASVICGAASSPEIGRLPAPNRQSIALQGPAVNRITYTVLFYMAMPLVLLRLLWRSLESPEYRSRWRERLGFYGARTPLPPQGPRIVFHAVSVGEVHAVVPLVRLLLAEHPDCRVVMTTATPTGAAR